MQMQSRTFKQENLYMSNSQVKTIARVLNKLDTRLFAQKNPEIESRNAFISAAGFRPHFEKEVGESIERDETGLFAKK